MGILSRPLGNHRAKPSEEARTLHVSITRALAGFVYIDSTIGRFCGLSEARSISIISPLMQALAINGTASEDETLGTLVGEKVRRMHESELTVNDLTLCVLSFFETALYDAKRFKADKKIIELLIEAEAIFGSTFFGGRKIQEAARLLAEEPGKFQYVAMLVDTGVKSQVCRQMPHASDFIEQEQELKDAYRQDNVPLMEGASEHTSSHGAAEKQTPLFRAVFQNDYRAVYNALCKGANPDLRSFVGYQVNPYSIDDEPGVPPEVLNMLRRQALDKMRWPQLFYRPQCGIANLYFPAMRGNIVMTHLLLEAGANPNAVSFNGLFPLYLAAESGHINIVRELVEHGAAVNQTTPKGCTALLNAAEEGHGDVVVYLLAHGADPDIANEFGVTPQMGAENHGHDKLAAFLDMYKACGDDCLPKNGDDYWWSREVMGQDVSERKSAVAASYAIIGSLGPIEHKTMDVQEMLAAAIAEQDLGMLAAAIENGCKLNEKVVYAGTRMTPAVEAVVLKNQQMLKMLLDAGADANSCQDNGETALMDAVNRGDVGLTKLLLDAGADPNLKTRLGTALMYAEGVPVMRLLLDAGADPNIPDEDGDLPIVGAIDSRKLEEIELLIARGTDMGHKNQSGQTPLERARLRNIYESVCQMMNQASIE